MEIDCVHFPFSQPKCVMNLNWSCIPETFRYEFVWVWTLEINSSPLPKLKISRCTPLRLCNHTQLHCVSLVLSTCYCSSLMILPAQGMGLAVTVTFTGAEMLLLDPVLTLQERKSLTIGSSGIFFYCSFWQNSHCRYHLISREEHEEKLLSAGLL